MVFDICGWVGMVLVLIAYALLSTNKITNGKVYQFLNLTALFYQSIYNYMQKQKLISILSIGN